MLIRGRNYEVWQKVGGRGFERRRVPFSGPVFVLTHEPPDPAVTFLTGDIMEAAATALDAAGPGFPDCLSPDSGPGTSDSPILMNWLSCRWTC